MNLSEFINAINNNLFSNVKEMNSAFNKLKYSERKGFLDCLEIADKTDFINKIRDQAVSDFWTQERELIKQGNCTRDWTAEQMCKALMAYGCDGTPINIMDLGKTVVDF